MNTQQLSYKGKAFSEVGCEYVSGQKSLGQGRLVARLVLSPGQFYPTFAASERPTHVSASGWLALGHAQNHVIDFVPETVLWPQQATPGTTFLDLRGTISFQQLDLLHEIRPAGDEPLSLTVYVSFIVGGPGGLDTVGYKELSTYLPASDWRRLLQSVGHSTYAAIEIPTGGGAVPAMFSKVAAALTKARAHLDRHQWDDAIASCRDAYNELEPIAASIEPLTVEWADYGDRQKREGWGMSERLKALRLLMRHATHVGHHGGGAAMDEARHVVDLTGLALRYYIRRAR